MEQGFLIDTNVVIDVLGNAMLIAATAIVNNQVLVTRNISDFNSIDNLTVFNPWD